MRSREDTQAEWEPFDPFEWPDDGLEIDDDEFAQAIAEGRGAAIAA